MTSNDGPFCQIVDGVRIPGFFSAEAFRSGLQYKHQPGDLFVCGHPKSGTTWAQQIVSLILMEGEPTDNFATFNSRSVFLDMCGSEGVDKLVRPGSIKTHVPFNKVLYSPEAKYIHIVRNPKDVVVSFYHHTNSGIFRYADGEFSSYFDLFINGKNNFGCFFQNVLSWYEHQDAQNILFLSYEKLKKDTRGSVKRMIEFIGKSDLLENDAVLENILKFSSIDYMKSVFNESFRTIDVDVNSPQGLKHFASYQAEVKKSSANYKAFQLVRKGVVGNWRTIFTEEQNKQMDLKIDQYFKDKDFYSYWKDNGCI